MNSTETISLPTNFAADEAVLRALAAQWRRAHFEGDVSFGSTPPKGFVVFAERQVAGWTDDLGCPRQWVPGCIATPTDGEIFVSTGGNDDAGAKEWIQWSTATTLRWGRPLNWAEEIAALREFNRLKDEMTDRECASMTARLYGLATIFGGSGELLKLPPLRLLEVAKEIVAMRDDPKRSPGNVAW